MAAGAGGLALAGGAGAVGAAAVMAGAAAPLAPVLIAGGGLVVGAALVGGAAVLAGAAVGGAIAEKVGDMFVSACYKNKPSGKWFSESAKYITVKNGAVDEQCGYEGNILKKEWLGTNHFKSPKPLLGAGDATRAFMVKKAKAADAVEDKADLPLEDAPTKVLCPMKFEEGMFINVPVGCVLFSKDDIGWPDIQGEHASMLACAVKDNGPMELGAAAINALGGDFKEISYIKAGKTIDVDFYSGENFDGETLAVDYESPAFIHLNFPSAGSVNDNVQSMRVTSHFDVDAVNTCDEYRSILFKKDEKQVLLDAVKAGVQE